MPRRSGRPRAASVPPGVGVVRALDWNHRAVKCVAFDPGLGKLAGGSLDGTVSLWDTTEGKLLRTFEWRRSPFEWQRSEVASVAFDPAGRLLTSGSANGTVHLWDTESGELLHACPGQGGSVASMAFHPTGSLLATGAGDGTVNLLDVSNGKLLRTFRGPRAEVVGVAFDSAGRTLARGSTDGTVILWDTTNGALPRLFERHRSPVCSVGFEPSGQMLAVGSLDNTVRLWDVPNSKLRRILEGHRGSVVALSFHRRRPLLATMGWDDTIRVWNSETWDVVAVIQRHARYRFRGLSFHPSLPRLAVAGARLHVYELDLDVLLGERQPAEAPRSVHYVNAKVVLVGDTGVGKTGLSLVDVCIGRLENRDLIRRLSFGDYVLLQPELLDAYASALVIAAKDEPDGLGSIAEERALSGQFHVPEDQRIGDRKQEQLLLHATVEELVRYDLALRESAADGRYLVFPSQFNRDYAEAPDPPGKAVAVTFEGPTQSIYATLAVRLGHSQLFETARTEMWRNAVIFTARAGGRCGIYLQEFGEGRGRLLLFFDGATEETRFHFEEYVLAHVNRRALFGTVQLLRLFVCGNCGTPVPDAYVELLREQRKDIFSWPCGGAVAIVDPKERLAGRYPSLVELDGFGRRSPARFRGFRAVGQRRNAQLEIRRMGG